MQKCTLFSARLAGKVFLLVRLRCAGMRLRESRCGRRRDASGCDTCWLRSRYLETNREIEQTINA